MATVTLFNNIYINIITMSEYFRKYIKKEYFPLHRYLHNHLVPISSSKHFLPIASLLYYLKGAINKLRMMIGIYTGAKSSLSLKLLTKLDFFPTRGSTIFEISMRSAEKIYFLKMSRSIKGLLRNRESLKRLLSIILCL